MPGMANEVTISVSLQINKNGVLQQLAKTVNRDLSGNNQISNVQTIGTDAEILSIGDLGNINHLAVVHLGTTENSVEISLENDASNPFANLAPGDVLYLPLPAATTQIYAMATGGTADLAILACET